MAKEAKDKKKKRPTAAKRMIQDEKKRQRNSAFKSRIHTSVRAFEKGVAEKGDVKEKLKTVFSMMDKAVKLGIFKKNKAARMKSKYQQKAS
ncbi:MAG: 30S ribosomal protein S20 [Candidatus Algichlamydia australiensis]|nr:30S ribosomal protein S20 [Chlamydiales bacterium]